MLAIRLQRTGRKGHAAFRVIVQDSRRTPTSGKVVVSLGSYDPHSKTLIVDKDKAVFYLEHGAQPSTRIAHLLKTEGIELPSWVKPPVNKDRQVRKPEKRRSTRADEPETPVENPAEEAKEAAEPPTEETTATPEAEKPPTDNPVAESPAEEAVETVENPEKAESEKST